jgi:16S rRNA (guanine527-N7)-methyltransferase
MNYPVPLDLSEALDDLRVFSDLTLHWTTKINLIGSGSSSDIWERHILDSAQVFHVKQIDGGEHIDIGSGGGFPGLVIAILNKAHQLPVATTLIESDQRKAIFLRTVIRTLNLNARVIVNRIENVRPLSGDILTARAVAPLPKLLGFVERHISSHGTVLLLKGKNWQDEVKDSREIWDFSLIPHQSRTNSDSRILQIEGLVRVQ